MKLNTLKSIIEKKKNKSEFAIITNLKTGESEIFEKDKPCLLYTSPSPRDRSVSRMPSSA